MHVFAEFMFRLFAKTVEDGAKNQLWASVAKGVQTGGYYDPVGKTGRMSATARDEKLAGELWEWTTKELAGHGAAGWP